MSRDLSGQVEQILLDLIVDHPMWQDDDGQPLEYTMEREGEIADFLHTASNRITDLHEASVDRVLALADKHLYGLKLNGIPLPEAIRDALVGGGA